MASLTEKVIGGHKYYYARICKRVNGVPKIVQTCYLGTAENIIKNSLERKIFKADEVYINELGATAALFDIANRLKYVEIIDKHVPKGKQEHSVGKYMLIAAINRATNPTSKAALADWFKNTIGPGLLKVTPQQLSSQAFWNHMDRLKKGILIKIEDDLLKNLIGEFGIDLKCLLYDATNFYTYICTNNTKSKLAQRGHNKQKRNDLRQVSLGMMTSTDFHIPLLHLVYGGNINDSMEFGHVIDELVKRYKELTDICPHITLVFDKGNNSESNFEAFEKAGLHFVGSLKLNQCKELLKIPLKEYKLLKGKKLETVQAYRTTQEVFGKERVIIITYNENLIAGQLQGIGRNIVKCRAELHDLQTILRQRKLGKIKKGKKPTIESIKRKVEKILGREYMSKIIKPTVSMVDKFVQIHYQIDGKAINRLKQTVLGKTILFTDNHEWTEEQIIHAYRGQYHIEHAFKDMKNPHFLGWNPRFHWTDQKIRVHAFYCVSALMFVSLLRREAAREGLLLSAEKLMEQLTGIRETISVYSQGNKKPKLSYSMSHLNDLQNKLFKFFDLQRFCHN